MSEDKELTPVGTYQADIEEYGVYEKNDKSYLELKLDVVDVERSKYVSLYLTESALENGPTLRMAAEIGYNMSASNPHVEKKQITVTCKHQVWDGKDVERWDILLPEFVKATPSEDKMSLLDAVLRKHKESMPTQILPDKKRDARAEAWDAIDKRDDMSDKEKQDLFQKLTEEYGDGVPASKMTDAQWDEVKDAGKLPF